MLLIFYFNLDNAKSFDNDYFFNDYFKKSSSRKLFPVHLVNRNF